MTTEEIMMMATGAQNIQAISRMLKRENESAGNRRLEIEFLHCLGSIVTDTAMAAINRIEELNQIPFDIDADLEQYVRTRKEIEWLQGETNAMTSLATEIMELVGEIQADEIHN